MFSIKRIFKKAKEKLRMLDNERLAIMLVSFFGLSLLLPLVLIAPGLLESEWFLDFLSIPAEYSSFIAGGAYIGRLVNLFTARSFATEKKEEKTKVKTLFNEEIVMGRQILIREKELTPVGMLLGIILGIVCISLHIAVPFLSTFSYFAYILFILGYACTVGGLFNRLGSSVDGTRLSQEKKAILFGIVLGCIFALSLIMILASTGTLPLIAVAGISKVFFELFVLHKTLFTLIFILSLTSLMASFFDYLAKTFCFVKYKYHLGSKDKAIDERIEGRYHEYHGAFLGTIVGCLLAMGIITGLILTGGLFAAPIAVCFTVVITFITCSSVISALFSRIGRVIDGINRISTPAEEKPNKSQAIIPKQNGNLKNNVKLEDSNLITEKKYYNNALQTNCLHISQKPVHEVPIYSNGNSLFAKVDQGNRFDSAEKIYSVSCPQEKSYSSHRMDEDLVGIGRPVKPFSEASSFDFSKNNVAFFHPDRGNQSECFAQAKTNSLGCIRNI